jgi:hypothetical protein
MSETELQEISAIEQGFRQALIGAFIGLYDNTSNQRQWSDAAIIRFRDNLANARRARMQALKVIGEDL